MSATKTDPILEALARLRAYSERRSERILGRAETDLRRLADERAEAISRLEAAREALAAAEAGLEEAQAEPDKAEDHVLVDRVGRAQAAVEQARRDLVQAEHDDHATAEWISRRAQFTRDQLDGRVAA